MSKSTKTETGTRTARAPESVGDPDIAFSAAVFAEVQDAMMREARQGNLQAIAIVERIWRHRRRTPTLDLPPVNDAAGLAAAQAAVIAAAAGGRITPHEGIAYAAMLDYRRRALDTVELEERLREIARGGGPGAEAGHADASVPWRQREIAGARSRRPVEEPDARPNDAPASGARIAMMLPRHTLRRIARGTRKAAKCRACSRKVKTVNR